MHSAERRAPTLSLPGGAAAVVESGACLEAASGLLCVYWQLDKPRSELPANRVQGGAGAGRGALVQTALLSLSLKLRVRAPLFAIRANLYTGPLGRLFRHQLRR
jgi:hypothetical protein